MDKLERLTTPTAQLIGSLATIGAVLMVTLLVALALGAYVEDAARRARDVAERAWIVSVLGGSAGDIDRDAISEHVDPVLLATAKPVVQYAPATGPDAGRIALKLTTPGGYNGAIEFAMSVAADGSIGAVTIIAHRETRGFGGDILKAGSRWLATFRGRALDDPERSEWRLSDAGGAIDGVSGATVTADAMITAINRGLRFAERLQQPVTDPNVNRTGVPVGR
ncbi:MAG: FMN-binding protein [Gammaproteobacteria bacterium]|jgi:electron transport complex protein RnfG